MSAPLDHDLTITGPLSADLFASTSGTDADFVVKLIDVYPEDAQKNAWDPDDGPAPGAVRAISEWLRVADRDGSPPRPLPESFEQPHALAANQPTRVGRSAARPRSRFSEGSSHHGPGAVDLVPDHRPQSAEICAQHLQSAGERLRSATQRVYSAPDRPSHLLLPVCRDAHATGLFASAHRN